MNPSNSLVEIIDILVTIMSVSAACNLANISCRVFSCRDAAVFKRGGSRLLGRRLHKSR